MEEEIGKLSIEMDSNNLFKETVYTDRKSGSIKMLEKINIETNTIGKVNEPRERCCNVLCTIYTDSSGRP